MWQQKQIQEHPFYLSNIRLIIAQWVRKMLTTNQDKMNERGFFKNFHQLWFYFYLLTCFDMFYYNMFAGKLKTESEQTERKCSCSQTCCAATNTWDNSSQQTTNLEKRKLYFCFQQKLVSRFWPQCICSFAFAEWLYDGEREGEVARWNFPNYLEYEPARPILYQSCKRCFMELR